jgi:hypothetical protein
MVAKGRQFGGNNSGPKPGPAPKREPRVSKTDAYIKMAEDEAARLDKRPQIQADLKAKLESGEITQAEHDAGVAQSEADHKASRRDVRLVGMFPEVPSDPADVSTVKGKQIGRVDAPEEDFVVENVPQEELRRASSKAKNLIPGGLKTQAFIPGRVVARTDLTEKGKKKRANNMTRL